MTEPWFDPMIWSWVPGTVFGSSVGILGGICGSLAAVGKAKSFVMGIWYLFLVIAILMLVAALVAFFSDQPYGIWFGLGLPGIMGTIIMAALTPVLLMRYREAERRSMAAQDLSP